MYSTNSSLILFCLSLGDNIPLFSFSLSTLRLFSDVLLTNSEKPQFKVEFNTDLLMFVEVGSYILIDRGG